MRFVADKYGPYSDRLRHLLNGLDGSYLHCDKRLGDAGPSDTIWFDEGRRAYLELYLKQDEQRALQQCWIEPPSDRWLRIAVRVGIACHGGLADRARAL